MGYKNNFYKIGLAEQARVRYEQMLTEGVGQSKRTAMLNGEDGGKIHSYNTYKGYKKQFKAFAKWIKNSHPECTNLRSARAYVNDWLRYQLEHGGSNGKKLSIWTLYTRRQAVYKLYGIQEGDPEFMELPKRERKDIVRSRKPAVRDKHFSEANNQEFVDFCRATGCRRNVVEKLVGGDLFTKADLKARLDGLLLENTRAAGQDSEMVALQDALEYFADQKYFIHHHTDKGGRHRYAPIFGKNADKVAQRMLDTPFGHKVWLHVPSNADIHGYRSEYATAIYKAYARPIEEIPYDKVNKGNGKRYQSEVYVCRKDEVGKRLDKKAMLIASKALGHNRIEVIAKHYLRGL